MADREPGERQRRPERHEPLPGLAEMPGRAWRRMGRRLRIGLGVALLAAVALGVALAGGIRESKQAAAESERLQRAERRERLVRRLEAEQRPRVRRSAAVAPPAAGSTDRLTGRAELMDELSAQVLADARRRARTGELDGPIRRTECELFPRTVEGTGEDDLSRRRRALLLPRRDGRDRAQRGHRRCRDRPISTGRGWTSRAGATRSARSRAAPARRGSRWSPPRARAGAEGSEAACGQRLSRLRQTVEAWGRSTLRSRWR